MEKYKPITNYKKVFKEEKESLKEDTVEDIAQKLSEIFMQTSLSVRNLGRAIGVGLIDNIDKNALKMLIKEIENGFEEQ